MIYKRILVGFKYTLFDAIILFKMRHVSMCMCGVMDMEKDQHN